MLGDSVTRMGCGKHHKDRKGEMVSYVEDLQRLDRARVLIKTSWPPTINHTITASINGVDYVVMIVEELCYNYLRCNCNIGSYVESFEEISSDGSEVGLDLMLEEAQVLVGEKEAMKN